MRNPLKSLIMVWMAVGMLAPAAQANLRVPPGVHFTEDLEQARAEAAEKGFGIVFVNVNHAGTNRDVNSRTLSVLRSLRSDAVVVLVPTQGLEATHNVNLPNNIRGQLSNRAMPGFPKVVLTDRELEGIVHRLLAEDLEKDERGEIRTLTAKAKELAENQGMPAGAVAATDPEMAEAADEAGAAEPATAPDAPLNFQTFTNQDGNTIRAAVLAVDGGTARFRREDGVEFDYPLAQLAAESQQRVRDSVPAPAAAP